MIPKDFIDTLLARVDIVDVIDRRVPLKKAGQNYQACCPFHQEKSPSFTVSPSKQFYHCFGCSAHGTAIGFLMEYGGLNFVDAVKELADDVGLVVPEVTGFSPRPQAAPQLGEALEAAASFYKQQLKGSRRAIDYLKDRGVTGAVAARFGLGYAPAQDGLKAVFPDYQAAELAGAGLVIDGERGRYDRFRDRIMFPIRNGKGNVIGFGGRILDRGEPKYLNSPETPLFNKGGEIYGLFEARQAIRAAGKLVVVEGYMDVLALAQFGIAYAVATLGTATTPIHARTLLRLADRVYYSFDGDNAGRKAAWRALENTLDALQDGKQVGFLFLPEGEDPDTYVRAAGAAAFENLLQLQAVPLSEFMVRHLIENETMTTQEGRARVLMTARPLLARLTGAPLLAALIRRELGQRLGVGGAEVDGLLGHTPAPRQKSGLRARKPNPPPRTVARQASLYRQIARLLMHKPDWADRVDLDQLLPTEPFAGELAELIAWLSTQTANQGAALEEAARGGPLEKLVETLHMEIMGLENVVDDPEADFSDLLKKFRLNWARTRYAELSQTPKDRLSAQELAERQELEELLRQT